MTPGRCASQVGGAERTRPAAGDDPAAGTDVPGTLRATLGCVQLPTDRTLHEEGPALLARVPGVRLRLARLTLPGERLDRETYAHARGTLGPAARTLGPVGSLDAVGLACTSLACTLGPASVRAELREGQPGARATDMATALVTALGRLDLRRVAWLSPYLEELDEAVLGLLAGAGVEVVRRHALGLETDDAIHAVRPDELAALARAQDHPEATGLVLACSAFRACGPGFLDDLEARLGKPVIASQQAFLWHLLRTAGVEDAVPGYGRLFHRSLRSTE